MQRLRTKKRARKFSHVQQRQQQKSTEPLQVGRPLLVRARTRTGSAAQRRTRGDSASGTARESKRGEFNALNWFAGEHMLRNQSKPRWEPTTLRALRNVGSTVGSKPCASGLCVKRSKVNGCSCRGAKKKRKGSSTRVSGGFSFSTLPLLERVFARVETSGARRVLTLSSSAQAFTWRTNTEGGSPAAELAAPKRVTARRVLHAIGSTLLRRPICSTFALAEFNSGRRLSRRKRPGRLLLSGSSNETIATGSDHLLLMALALSSRRTSSTGG